MNNRPFLRITSTMAVAIAQWSLLAWQHFHDGIPRYHFFMCGPDCCASARYSLV
jgi:hypothetical protein